MKLFGYDILIKKAIAEWPFDLPHSTEIDTARLEHLASLGLNIRGRVLEVGSGIGLLTHFFEERGCRIWSTEGRAENVFENLRRHPHRRGRVFLTDLAQEKSHARFDCFSTRPFEIVFCYGVLYHLSDPARCIASLASLHSGLFLLETYVNPRDNGKINPVKEDSKQADQSLRGDGCRPARDWIFTELRKHYKYVYLTVTQPRHWLYPLTWPTGQKQAKAVFVASHTKLNVARLSTKCLARQRYLNSTTQKSETRELTDIR